MSKIINVNTGDTYGKLVVVKEVDPEIRKTNKGTYKVRKVICKCSCGTVKEYLLGSIRSGHAKSCGCSRIEGCVNRLKQINNVTHGLTKHPLYTVWMGMKQRCYNQNTKRFKRYGGRNISICTTWLNDFKTFYDWALTNGYSKGLQIDRRDNDGDYCPSNCHWTTNKANSRNKENTHIITYCGVTLPLAEHCEQLGRDYGVMYDRIIRLGWDIDEAFDA